MYPESSKYQISVLGRMGEVKKKKRGKERETIKKGMKLLNSSNEQERK